MRRALGAFWWLVCIGVACAPRAVSAPTSTPPRRCLPVVSCGCALSCGSGGPAEPDGARWLVTHPLLGRAGQHPIGARLGEWCAKGTCIEAFVEQVDDPARLCDGVNRPAPCASPEPADGTCHFEGERCVGR